MKQKLISMTGVLVMLIGITFVTVGCDQANKAGGNGDNNPGNVTNSNNQNNSNNNQNNNSNNEIAGVWKVLKLGSTTFPTPMTAAPGWPGVPAEAKQQLYLCLTTDKKVIQVVEITGFPQANGFSKNPTEGAYKLLSGNKVEIDLGDGNVAHTVSYTISGINLKLIEVQIEAVKVTSPTEAEIKALP